MNEQPKEQLQFYKTNGSKFPHEAVIKIIEMYRKTLGLTESEVIKKIKGPLLGLTEENVNSKISSYQETFKTSKEETIKKINGSLQLLGYAEESVIIRIKFYQDTLKISRDEAIEMIKDSPQLLGLSEQSVNARIDLYQDELRINKDKVSEMIVKWPALLGYPEETVLHKVRILEEIGISKPDIVFGPKIFSAPHNSIKIRFMQHCSVFGNEADAVRRFLRGNFMVNEHKIHARLYYANNNRIRNDIVYRSEKDFKRATGKNSEDLMQMPEYSFGIEQIEKLVEDYNKRFSPKIKLTDEEKGILQKKKTKLKGGKNGTKDIRIS